MMENSFISNDSRLFADRLTGPMRLLSGLLFLFFFYQSAPLPAQNAVRQAAQRRLAQRDKHYLDTLKQVRDSIFRDSTWLKQPYDDSGMLKYSAGHYRLFTPPTLYEDQIHRLFSLSPVDSVRPETPVSFFLTHPSLVAYTEQQLRRSNTVRVPDDRIMIPPLMTIPEEEAVVVPEPAVPEEMNVKITRPNFWNYSGDYYLQFLQNYVSGNWYKGGESSYSMLGSVILQANYNNKQKVKWDNKLELKLGFQTSKSDSLHSLKTSEDFIRYTSKLGLQASRRWYYTIQLIAQTQFMRTYRNNDRRVYSDFMSPFNLNLSIGMDYNVSWIKNRLTGTIHLAPLAYNFKFVDRLGLATGFGLDEGRHQLHDFGSTFNIDVTWKLLDNLRWRARWYGYTTYHRVEFECENTFTFQFNKFITSNVVFYPRFDDQRAWDDHHGYWMFKEYCSIGFSYSF